MSTKKLMTILMGFSIFSSAFVYGGGYFEFYLAYIIFFCFLSLYFFPNFKIYLNKMFLAVLLIIVIISFINAALYGLSVGLIIKQAVGILFSALAYYLLFKINNYNIERLFKLYMYLAFIVCLIGIFQELSFLIHFTPGYNFSWLVSSKWILPYENTRFLGVGSIMTEPAAFAIVLSPAMFVALNNLIFRKSIYINRMKSIIIMIAFLLSLSTTGYIGILCSFIIILYRRTSKKVNPVFTIMISAIIIIFVFTAYSSIHQIRTRIDDASRVLGGQEINMGNVKYSVFALYSNLRVTEQSLIRNPLFGSALGNHVENHKRYIAKIFPQYTGNDYVNVNREDANSLFLRLMSETGIFGLMIVVYFLKTYFVSKNSTAFPANNLLYAKYAIINNGVLILILLRLFRHGHYFSDGLFFFVFLYYFTSKLSKKETRLQSLQLKGIA